MNIFGIMSLPYFLYLVYPEVFRKEYGDKPFKLKYGTNKYIVISPNEKRK